MVDNIQKRLGSSLVQNWIIYTGVQWSDKGLAEFVVYAYYRLIFKNSLLISKSSWTNFMISTLAFIGGFVLGVIGIYLWL